MLRLGGSRLRINSMRPRGRVIRGQNLDVASADAILAAINEAVPVRLSQLQDVELRKAVEARDPLTKYVSAFDMFGLYQGIREREGYSTISYQTLRRMARQCPPVAAIIQTRCNQVAAFAQRPASRVDSGFKVVMRDRDAKPTEADKKRIAELETAILRCGLVEPDPALGEHTFPHFVRMLVRDTLCLDAMAVEIRPGRNSAKYPALRWQAVDAAEIRKVEPAVYRQDRMLSGRSSKPVLYVQWRDGQVQAEYTDAEMVYGIRNPSSDHTTLGYGISELEMAVDLISSTLFAIHYNKTFFTQSSVPPGIISIVGSFSEETFEAFRRQWAAQVGGPGNHWRTPLIGMREGQGVQYVPFRPSSRDMEYHLWLQFLATFICAIYSIHPEEIGIQAWSPMRPSLSESSPVSRLKHSEDKGLVPLLNAIAALINEILWKIDPNFEFTWVNLSEYDEEADLRAATQRIAYLTTVNEERRLRDMEPLEGEEYDVVLNPLVVQMRAQRQQMEMIGRQDGEPAEGDEDIEDHFRSGGREGGDERAFMFENGGGEPFARSLAGGPLLTLEDQPPGVEASGTYIRELGVPERVWAALEAEGLRTVGDLSIPSATELGLILDGGGISELRKALTAAGFTICNENRGQE